MDTQITTNIDALSFSQFSEYPKMPRLSREVIVTEKIDGTNAQIYIERTTPQIAASFRDVLAWQENMLDGSALALMAGSRSRWLTRETDNFGFAKWVQENQTELFKLGEGRHFGEWWGSGIQRGYGLSKGEKRFSLFNVDRWIDSHIIPMNCGKGKVELAPKCCHVVPILARGEFTHIVSCLPTILNGLRTEGSAASRGFSKPEGVVIWHVQGRFGLKKTLEKDEQPKSRC